jgi:hypothetical protein
MGEGRPGSDFTLTGGADDQAVVEKAVACVRQVCSEFLLNSENPNELYSFVRDSAFGLADRGLELHDDFWRMHLRPWNAMARLELAGV